MSDSAARMWEEFTASGSPLAPDAAFAGYSAWHFGSGGEMADELASLVLEGAKRATAGAQWAYDAEGDELPEVGDYSVILDGSGEAACIIRTAHVDIVPFNAVDADFAAAEGEGDLSLEYWREGHWRFISMDLASWGLKPTEDMPIVCERFEVVWPPEAADR